MLAETSWQAIGLFLAVILNFLLIAGLFLAVIANIICTIVVFLDANDKQFHQKQTWPFGPFLWGFTVLLTGIFGAMAYWLINMSEIANLEMKKTNQEKMNNKLAKLREKNEKKRKKKNFDDLEKQRQSLRK